MLQLQIQTLLGTAVIFLCTVCNVLSVSSKAREVCGSTDVVTFRVTQRLDGEPGGLDDRAEAIKVRSDFSSPPRIVAPHVRPTGLSCAGPGPVEPGRRGRLRKHFGKCERGGRGPGAYRWQAFPLPAASLSTLTTWVSDGRCLHPVGPHVLHARQGNKNGSSTPIKPHMVLFERHWSSLSLI